MRRFKVAIFPAIIISANLSYLSAQSGINSIDSIINAYIDQGQLNSIVLVAGEDRVISYVLYRIIRL